MHPYVSIDMLNYSQSWVFACRHRNRKTKMLNIWGPKDSQRKLCSGVSRRTFLSAGSLGLLTLPQLLRAEADTGQGKSHKSVIMIYL